MVLFLFAVTVVFFQSFFGAQQRSTVGYDKTRVTSKQRTVGGGGGGGKPDVDGNFPGLVDTIESAMKTTYPSRDKLQEMACTAPCSRLERFQPFWIVCLAPNRCRLVRCSKGDRRLVSGSFSIEKGASPCHPQCFVDTRVLYTRTSYLVGGGGGSVRISVVQERLNSISGFYCIVWRFALI